MDDVANALDYIFQDGSFRWDRTIEAREAEYRKFIEEYLVQDKEPSDEELVEMKATFGEGSKVVDIISGKEIQL